MGGGGCGGGGDGSGGRRQGRVVVCGGQRAAGQRGRGAEWRQQRENPGEERKVERQDKRTHHRGLRDVAPPPCGN